MSSSQRSKRSLAPAPGVTPPPTEGSTYRFLSDVIMARGLVEPSAMKAALQASLAGRSLTDLLVDNGHLGADDLARTLAEHHRLDHVDLEVFDVDHEAAALIEPDVARRFGAVPIATLASGAIVVALHDPNGSTAALEFARLTGRMIQPAVASRAQVDALIDSMRRERTSIEDMPPLVSATPPARDVVAASPDGEQAELPGAAVAPPPPDGGRRSAGGDDSHVDAVRQRAELAEQRCHAADERARAAEELTRLAEARARASEERAQAAGDLVVAAEARGGEPSPAAGAADDMFERLVHACEMLEREAKSRGPEADVLRTLLETERAQRMHLEAQLRHPPDVLVALQTRVAELERLVSAPAPQAAAQEPRAAESEPEPEIAEPAPPLGAPEPRPVAPEADFPAPRPHLADPEPEPHLADAAPELLLADAAPGLLARPEPEPQLSEPTPAEPFGEADEAVEFAAEEAFRPEPRAARPPVKPRGRRGLFGSRDRGA
jgi:hypothetical protein